ncbi:hypothetical protein FRB95_006464 [Tulasnella sp. JGI-2019a]|nr:hypothetical protein FRB95_006464 [Tulasnella sp. JGI-2019a]
MDWGIVSRICRPYVLQYMKTHVDDRSSIQKAEALQPAFDFEQLGSVVVHNSPRDPATLLRASQTVIAKDAYVASHSSSSGTPFCVFTGRKPSRTEPRDRKAAPKAAITRESGPITIIQHASHDMESRGT